MVRSYTTLILKWPVATILLLLLVTLAMMKPAMTFEKNMTKDIEVYLPDNDPSVDVLLEVREFWATDTIIIYVETPNALDKNNSDSKFNVTSVNILKQIDALEREIDPFGQSKDQENYPADGGETDGIIFTLSISTLIKEFNSTNTRFVEALEDKTLGGLTITNEEATGTYAIPDDQDRIDTIYDNTEGALRNFAKDTNDDGILDTAAILFGLKYEGENNDEAQKVIIDRIQAHLDRTEEYRNTEMSKTGLVIVLHEVTERLYKDLLDMIPLSIGIVLVMMFYFHRNILSVPIVLIPIFCALVWTLGLIKMSGEVLTPMIVAAGPILIGIGVDYGLHVSNRIVEFKEREENIEFEDATHKAMMTTGKATLLCAVTDSIGFSALFISPIAPMRTVGLTMIVGVLCAFFLTVTMMPAIMSLTNYKRHHPKAWKGVAEATTRGWKVILVVVLIVTAYSLAQLSAMDQDIRGDESAPEDVESIRSLAKYSDNFGSGQTGIILIAGNMDRDKPVAKDMDTLEVMNSTQNEINNITKINRNSNEQINVSSFSIVNFFKSAHISIQMGEDPNGDAIIFEGSFWDFLTSDIFGDDFNNLDIIDIVYGREAFRQDMIDVFYDSFTDEMRAMLLTPDYQKALIYTSMPYVNIDDTALIIEDTNYITSYHNLLLEDAKMSEMSGGPPISIAINEGIQDTQYKTIMLSLALVLATMIIIFRSVKFGVVTFLPIFIVVLWYPATVYNGGTNLNIFTAMVGTIIIGIGIDNSIQVTERVREEGTNPKGIEIAVENTGQSVVEATFTTMGGILAGVLIAVFSSQFVGLKNFFMLIIILILFSLLLAVFALPSFYHGLYHLRKNYEEKFKNLKTTLKQRP